MISPSSFSSSGSLSSSWDDDEPPLSFNSIEDLVHAFPPPTSPMSWSPLEEDDAHIPLVCIPSNGGSATIGSASSLQWDANTAQFEEAVPHVYLHPGEAAVLALQVACNQSAPAKPPPTLAYEGRLFSLFFYPELFRELLTHPYENIVVGLPHDNHLPSLQTFQGSLEDVLVMGDLLLLWYHDGISTPSLDTLSRINQWLGNF